MRLGARGGQLKLVIGSAHSGARDAPDAVLLNALARAHRWLGRLVSGADGPTSAASSVSHPPDS